MQPLSRRGVALLATTAALGAGSLSTVAQASSAATFSNTAVRTDRSILDPLVVTALNLLGTLGVPLATLPLNTPDLLGQLLGAANPTQLNTLLTGLTDLQLSNAIAGLTAAGTLDDRLGTMTAAQRGDLLDRLTGDALASTLATLTGAQLAGALPELTPANLPGIVGALDPAQTGALIGALSSGSPAQLTTVLGALQTGQLAGGLSVLSLEALGDVIAPLSGGNLTAVLAPLSDNRLNGALATLSTLEATAVLGQLTNGKITSLLGAATPTQLTGLLGVLSQNPAQLSTLLGLLTNVTQLTSVVGALTPAQITSLLGQAGAPTILVSGLTNRAYGVGAAPNATDVNALLAQVQALLGAGLPALPGVDGLLNALKPLLGVAGRRHVAADRPAGHAQRDGRSHAARASSRRRCKASSALGRRPSPRPASSRPARRHPARRPRKPATKPGTGATAGPAVFRAYRATVGTIKVAKNRKSAKVTRVLPGLGPEGLPRGARRRRRRQEGVRPEGRRRPAQRQADDHGEAHERRGQPPEEEGRLHEGVRAHGERLARVDQQVREGREAAEEGGAQALIASQKHRSLPTPEVHGVRPWTSRSFGNEARGTSAEGRAGELGRARRPARLRPVMDHR